MSTEVLSNNPKQEFLDYFEKSTLKSQVQSKLASGTHYTPQELKKAVQNNLQERYTELSEKGADRSPSEMAESKYIHDLDTLLDNNPDLFEDAAEEIGCIDPEKKAEQEQEKINNFYETDHFTEVYIKAQKAKESKGDYSRVKAEDVGAILQKGNQAEQDLYQLLVSKDHQALSRQHWIRSEVRRDIQESYDNKEQNAVNSFIKDQLKPQDLDDLEAAALRFQKENPEFSGKEKIKWFKEQVKVFEKELEAKWKTEITNFYKSDDFKAAYKAASIRLGYEPNGADILAELKKDSKNEEILFLMSKYEKHSLAEWHKVWESVSESNYAFENKALAEFTKNLKPQDWEDVTTLAAKFQDTHPKRFAGKDRLDWYTKRLGELKKIESDNWKQDVNNFYQNQLAGIYAEAANNLGRAPKWQDIRKLVTDPNLLHLLENNFKTESEALWTAFWKAEKEKFNEAGDAKLKAFLNDLEPEKLDSLEQAKTAFEQANPNLKADEKWFKPAYEKAHKEALNSYNTNHQTLVNTLPDSALAAAMHSAFKSANNFADRKQWLAENRQKVAEYAPLIEQNNQQENELAARAEEHPDLKKELGKIKGEYKEGKKSYTENFYSPRKYAAALSDLNTKLNERERLVDKTITTAENKTFNQIPKLTDKKKLTYDEFRDALKKLNFYGLDPAVRKNKKVRTALRTKTTALHQQWLDHRTLHIEQNQRTKIEKSQVVVRRVKLPKNLPAGLKSYEDFAVALKEKGVYAALPKGVLKNDKVRATAHDQNLKMWTAYQAAQAKVEAKTETPENAEIANNPKLEKAQNVIKGVTLNTALKTKLDEKLNNKDATNPDTFTVALREIGIYQGVDKSLWQTPALRELAWQQNIKLQKEYLSPDANKTVVENDQQAESNAEHGLPGHYKLDWKGLDSRLAPDQKARGIERFKQMHNRSDIGLQTLMSQFHGPLGTFILETLAVMPKDRYEKAVNALRDVRVEAGKRDQASEWMKTLCQAAGTDYLQKEASASWSNFRQNFSTHFGQNIDKAWAEPELEEETIEVTETSEELADNTAERATSILDAPIEEDDTPTPPANDEPIATDDTPEAEPTMVEATEPEPILKAPVDDELNLEDDLTVDDIIDEPLPEIDDTNLEAEEPVIDNTEELIDEPVLAESDVDSTESTDSPTIEGEETFDENPETEDTDLETDEVMTDDFESDEIQTDDPEAETVNDEDGEAEPDLEETTDDTPDDLENPDVTEETAETEAELSENVDTEDTPEETEAVTEEPPEIIKIVLHTPEQQTTRTQSATQAWKATKPPQDDTGVMAQLTPKWLKPKETNELPTEEELEAMLADPNLNAALKAKIEAQLTVKNKEPHFTTTLYQEVHFASSMTVAKFLQQLKTYALLSANLQLTIGQHNPSDEITKQQAQALFEAFSEKLHSNQNLKTLSASMTKEALQVNSGAQVWMFEIE